MTQIAKMILNELPISKSINEKIAFIKDSALSFRDFNSFRLLLNGLENFEPNPKLHKDSYKAQINQKIAHLLESLNVLEQKILNNTQSDSPLNQDFNTTHKAKLLSFLAKLEEITSLQEINKEQIGFLLESASELLLNQESLNKNEIELLEEAKEILTEYHLQEAIFKNSTM
ncbi:hypothetical protein [Helicobacter turcicus]|uniref:Uncharacterized protein n=1 Tax=Helicobacter turcicus TaxID=2867412 RepID=A0ABS7JPE0_9HELI|nr:hypothetical protein [Helicobacter turcicus]MBX7491235.1 hypothetical protein [Helicobacter turcicus]MBX7546126.1 hypothetical protein [Helicobacter turcicus]